MRSVGVALLFFGLGSAQMFAAATYKLAKTIPLPGDGGWDYSTADSNRRRLYVSHGTEVEVLDFDSEKLVGKIPDTDGVHGIAIANDLGRGFISAGRANQVVIFDLKSLRTLGTAKTGTNPDGILYEPTTHRVFAFNGRSKNATAIDAASGEVVGTIDLGGKPEFPVADGRGNVFVNIEDKNEIVHLDPKTLSVKAHWSIAPAEAPSGLAIDIKNHRLFAVCDSKAMLIVNSDTGKIVATVPIGEGPDAAGFDPAIGLAFSSNGQDGTLTVVKKQSADKYSVAQTVSTKRGARTMAIDLKTHNIYLPDADFGPAPAGNPHARPKVIPGTFKLLVVSR
jgi:DNA-binding beta-propeller fold protein YncE